MGENYFGITDPGRQRDNNEDRFIAQPVFSKSCILACVIDGVGGYAGGEIAADITKDTIIKQLVKKPANLSQAMFRALEIANERIFKEKAADPQHEKMACVATLAIVDLEKNKFFFAHVGDTRLYLFRDNSLVKITTDHSAVGFLEESGRITEIAAMQHPKRNEVNKALGYEPGLPLAKDFIDTGESPFLPGDTILLCSDGLTDMVSSASIVEILQQKIDLAARATQLVAAANTAGGKDNVTVVLVYNHKSPAKHLATKPIAVTRVETTAHHPVDLPDLAITEPATLKESVGSEPKKGNGLLKLMVVLCIVFFAGFAYLFYKGQQQKEPKLLMPPPSRQQNDSTRSLQDSITVPGKKVLSLNGAHSLRLNDAVLIDKDSFQISGNGITLVSDTGYKGPAFILTGNARNILLDSLTFSGFDVAVVVSNKGLQLKNVRFEQCRVPVLFENRFPQNVPVSGTQAETIFYHRDSLYK